MLESEIEPYDNENEADAIVKRIREKEEELEEEETDVKRIFLTLFGIATVGVVGYLGFNYVQSGQSEKSLLALSPKVEHNSSVSKENDAVIKKVEETLMVQRASHAVKQTKEPILPIIPTPSKIVKAEEPKREEAVEETVAEKKIVQAEIKKEEVKEKKIIQVKPKKVVAKKVVSKKVKPRMVTIKKGDTLASIAEKFYGNPMDFKRIIRANRSIRNKHSHLSLGQKIIVPYMEKSKRDRMFSVRKGSTLASISKRFYGTTNKVQKIVDANYNIKTENSILHLGQKIYIPK